MPMKRSILYLALFFGVLRAILLFYNNPYYFLNIDEESNYEVATNHYKGRGYTYFDPKKMLIYPLHSMLASPFFCMKIYCLKTTFIKDTGLCFAILFRVYCWGYLFFIFIN